MAHSEPSPSTDQLTGTLLLTLAAGLWGFGFYAQRLSVLELAPLLATSLRFLLALPFALLALWWRRSSGRPPWRMGIAFGVLTYLVFSLQAVAVLHAPVSRVALLASLYVAVTPVLQPLFQLGRPGPLQLVAAMVAVLGAALLCGIGGGLVSASTPFNLGDAFALASTIVASLYVLLVGRYAKSHDPLALSGVQVAAMTAISIVVAALFEDPPALSALSQQSWLSLLYLAVFSTVLAFLLQLSGQRHVAPAPATTILLLETPIAMIAAMWLLGEKMVPIQWFGALLAIISVVLATWGKRPNDAPAAP